MPAAASTTAHSSARRRLSVTRTVTTSARLSARPPTFALRLELDVLDGRPGAHPDVGDGVLRHPRPDPDEHPQVHHRGEHHPVDRELLDLEQQRLALLHVT